MSDILTALALVLVIEGLLWAILPEGMKQAALRTAQFESNALRLGGLVVALVGVFCVWLVRG